jgi:GT2 family glycosyltransferase
VVFLDDDCLPDAQLLLNYNRALVANPHIRVFEGRISPDRARTRMDEEAPINETGGLLWSCNFMIAKQLFEQLGGFNDAFQHAAMEDVDFRKRAQHNCEIRFVASAFVIHPWRRVTQPRLKWNRALLAHKTYIKLQPSDESFRAGRFTKQILTSITRGTLRDIVRFKAAGINYALYFHLFQMRLLAHLVFRR